LCGIVGYIGFRDANKVLLECLKRLEYRGYDSAGIATLTSTGIDIKKDVGEIDKINEKLNFEEMGGNTGIGHCLHPDTFVFTPKGLCKISELKGQEVLSIRNGKLESRKYFLTKHRSPPYLYLIKTPFSEFRATGEHRVFVYDSGKIREKRIRELSGKESIAVLARRSKKTQAPIRWTSFSIKRVKSDVEYVYDLEVEQDHNFIGNLVVQHNSRWATHGGVTKANAHPHTDCEGNIAIVHNGIIENFRKLKKELQERGHVFSSETDTEVIAHLIEENEGSLEEAVLEAIKRVKGSYALVVMSKDEDKLVGVRKESPLIIGLGDKENFIASDIPAFLKFTNRVIYLNDDEICTITRDSVKVFNNDLVEIKKEENLIEWDVKDAEKSGFPHFMLKEIYDQPYAIHQALRGRISTLEHSIEFDSNVDKLLNVNSIHIVACGTSFYAGLVGKYIIERLADIPVSVSLASEYRYFDVKKASLVIAISQSGETADTIAALKEAKNAGCKTLVITNVIGSTVTRIGDGFILNQSGPEIGVAATKTFSSQIVILFLIALKIAYIKSRIGSDDLYNYILSLKELPRLVRQVLDKSNEILKIARNIKDANSVFFIGRGINYPLSLEGALKLKEISYIHAEGFAAGELKHGPFALLTEDTPVVAIVTMDSTYDKIISNIDEVKARGSPVIAIADERDNEVDKHADFVIRYPSKSNLLSCFPITVILQLLAYHVANLRGCPIDKPRNLAKSVTVE
jgi:glucosamine--fructose-6-phosphate aminotransferase (isomerizing)